MTGQKLAIDSQDRSDIKEVVVPSSHKNLFTQPALREMEQASGTMMLFADTPANEERLMIVSWDPGSATSGRLKAQRDVKKLLTTRVKLLCCNAWADTGKCSKGDNCTFAHGEHEVGFAQPTPGKSPNGGGQPQ